MKQHITKKQWDELEFKQKKELYNFYTEINWMDTKIILKKFNKNFYYLFTIGQMIEFLGNDLIEIHNNFVEKIISVEIVADKNNFKSWAGKQVELINLLWKAVKYKLK